MYWCKSSSPFSGRKISPKSEEKVVDFEGFQLPEVRKNSKYFSKWFEIPTLRP